MQRATLKSSHRLLIRICVLGSLAGLLFGMDTGIIGGALPLITKQFLLSTDSKEMVVSAVLFGALLGTISCNFIGKPLGRRRTIMVAALVFVIGSLLSSLAPSRNFLIVARIILGMGVGMAAFSAPLYLSEVSPSKYRGAIISLYQTMVNLGIATAMTIGVAFTYMDTWRPMLFSLAIPAVFLFIGTFFVPPSPRWLVMVKRKDKAVEVLTRIRGSSETEARKEVKAIEEVEAQATEGFEFFRKNRNFRKVIYLGIALQAAQQLTGINIMFYYAPKIFEICGFSSSIARIWGGLSLALLGFICTLSVIAFVDKVGRKPLLYWGAVGMGAAFLGLSGVFYGGIHTTIEQVLAVLMLVIFTAAFFVSSAPVTWILCAEINPLKGRNFGMMLSTCTNWATNLVIAATFLSLLNSAGDVWTFALYGVINLSLLVIYYFFTPETKGVPLEDIEKRLMEGIPLKNIGK
ncbi:sugar porter family MFS transporter [Rubellicoccus peritrichatus]|uniref:Sugar porter family MFS transporter n=1 Tax=Rubellicoccus peritrichatus TaxID=3080537 RepID=A0AAQ3LK44_9BACT|nr:sugar porter family MFS transporter [Puniceicoccus sp. CR14]WOO43744.1 sugar porter family MFS transporter [Puniceicoccus sp. CR14]